MLKLQMLWMKKKAFTFATIGVKAADTKPRARMAKMPAQVTCGSPKPLKNSPQTTVSIDFSLTFHCFVDAFFNFSGPKQLQSSLGREVSAKDAQES